jgi:hypothetical protein
MRISKTISLLSVASLAFIVSTVIAQDQLLLPDQSEFGGHTQEDAIFVGLVSPSKGDAGLPKDLRDQDSAFQADDADQRQPASVKATQKAKTAQHWSTSTTDGFEFKVRIKKQISAVWVMKREGHYDLIFANNNGSRLNLSIPAEQFYALKNAATGLRAPASDLSTCKDQFIQLEMVETNSRKTVSTCLNTKSKLADQLRQFGSTLTAYVR